MNEKKKKVECEDMVKVVCPDCAAEFDIPDDVMVGEIVSCPDCGLDLEVENVEGSTVEIQKIAIEKEDWGE
ncbi:MAG: alpha-aminoadipate/glutamate carrier protein LysW [Thermoproteota archaeon]|nr:alpha-aminoadipate/glutamate carrier protein LysW [Thermoproteota archaeon]